jgi:hypothetical protein
VPDSTPRAACLATSRHRHRGLPPAPNDQSELACPPGPHAHDRVFYDHCSGRRDPESAGGFQERVGRGFAWQVQYQRRVPVHASVEQVGNARILQHGGAVAAARHNRGFQTGLAQLGPRRPTPERPRRPSAGVESGVPSRSAMSREARKSRTLLDAACRRRRRRSRSVRRTARCGPHAWRPMSGGIRRTGASRPPHAPSEWCQNAVEVVQHGIEVLRDDWRRHRDPFGQFKARARRSTPRPSAVMVRIGRGAST